MPDRPGSRARRKRAYGRVSEPERLRELHAAGRELLEAPAEEFVVAREPFLDAQRPDGPEPAEILHPTAPGAASLGLTFTEAPGAQMWSAGRRHGHLPMCACAACDETLQSCLYQLVGWADTITCGSFGETLSIEHGVWWHTHS